MSYNESGRSGGAGGPRVGLWVALAILIMMLLGSVLTNVGLVAALFAGGSGAGTDYPVDEEPAFSEIWSHGYGETKVVRIGLGGVIMRGQQERLFGYEPDMVQNILGQIRAATIDEAVKAIILEVDSPGGAVTPSDEIYAALEYFKRQDSERLIMVFIRDLGASGAYYAAMAGDYIFAEPTAIVGSVGVIMQTLNVKGLGDKLGVKSVTIASGANKDMLNPFKEVNPEHEAILQEVVDSMQERFASIVQRSRGFSSRALLDGRIYTAEQALDNGFIDQIGYWQDAVNELKKMMGVEELFIVRYQREVSLLESLISARVPKLPNMEALQSPRLLYLWKP